MEKNNLKNFIWNSIGSIVFGFTSLFFMIIVTRINGIEEAGRFTFAFANACIFWTIAAYSGRTYQVTERNKEICDSDYFYNRITTSLFSIIIAVIFALITRTTPEKFILIVLLTFYRSIDAVIESMHAVTQRNGELYKAGMSLFFRTIILVIVFTILNVFTKNLIIASISLIIVNLIFMFAVDFRNIKDKFTKRNFDFKINNQLLQLGFTTFLYSFLTIYVTNATKYAINSFTNDEMQAVFGIIIMPASFLSLISTYLVQPFLNSITEYLENNDIKSLKVLVSKLSLAIILIGLFATGACYLIGIPILELIYGVSLNEQKINLIIILLGSILYSLVILLSAIFIALRKTNDQLFLLVLTAVAALISSNLLVKASGMNGAAMSYMIVMTIELLLHIVTIFFILKEKKFVIRLMGGLGNQMFEYSALRTMMLENKTKGIISLKGITNKTHNVYCLNHFNISSDIKIVKGESIKSFINYLFYGFYYVFLISKKNGFKIIQKIQPLLNHLGFYCVPDGFIELREPTYSNNVMVGYYQSLNYFNKYKSIIKDELKVTDKVLEKNETLLKDIKKTNSVCVHIRRGDYVGSNHLVCNEKYYLDAENIILEKVNNPKLFIFSDDQEWVKKNIKFKSKVTYVEGNNNYEDLRLMYSCKHFIISNSSFSWWAQYLTDNENRVTIAPSKWFQNSNQKSDIYEDDWIIVEVDN